MGENNQNDPFRGIIAKIENESNQLEIYELDYNKLREKYKLMITVDSNAYKYMAAGSVNVVLSDINDEFVVKIPMDQDDIARNIKYELNKWNQIHPEKKGETLTYAEINKENKNPVGKELLEGHEEFSYDKKKFDQSTHLLKFPKIKGSTKSDLLKDIDKQDESALKAKNKKIRKAIREECLRVFTQTGLIIYDPHPDNFIYNEENDDSLKATCIDVDLALNFKEAQSKNLDELNDNFKITKDVSGIVNLLHYLTQTLNINIDTLKEFLNNEEIKGMIIKGEFEYTTPGLEGGETRTFDDNLETVAENNDWDIVEIDELDNIYNILKDAYYKKNESSKLQLPIVYDHTKITDAAINDGLVMKAQNRSAVYKYFDKNGRQFYQKVIEYDNTKYKYIGSGNYNIALKDVGGNNVIKIPINVDENISEAERCMNRWNMIYPNSKASMSNFEDINISSRYIDKKTQESLIDEDEYRIKYKRMGAILLDSISSDRKSLSVLKVPYIKGKTWDEIEIENKDKDKDIFNQTCLEIIKSIREECLRIFGETGLIIHDGNPTNFIFNKQGDDSFKATCIDVDLALTLEESDTLKKSAPSESDTTGIAQILLAIKEQLNDHYGVKDIVSNHTVTQLIINGTDDINKKIVESLNSKKYTACSIEGLLKNLIESSPSLKIEILIDNYISLQGGLRKKNTHSLFTSPKFWIKRKSKTKNLNELKEQINQILDKPVADVKEELLNAVNKAITADKKIGGTKCQKMLQECKTIIEDIFFMKTGSAGRLVIKKT